MDDRTAVLAGRVVYHKVSGERMYCEGVVLGEDLRLLATVRRGRKSIHGHLEYFPDKIPTEHLETYEARELEELASLRYLNAVTNDLAEEQTVN